jgi:hypothetical protein
MYSISNRCSDRCSTHNTSMIIALDGMRVPILTLTNFFALIHQAGRQSFSNALDHEPCGAISDQSIGDKSSDTKLLRDHRHHIILQVFLCFKILCDKFGSKLNCNLHSYTQDLHPKASCLLKVPKTFV